jgi:hypothetical protein
MGTSKIDFPEMVRLAPPGLMLEFGVASGNSLNELCRAVDGYAPTRGQAVYGFDWFYGLPEAWPPDSYAPGLFSQDGKLPRVEKNGHLIVGKVEDTLEPFLYENQHPVAIVHFDMDLYAPTKFVLDRLRFQNGSILAFDEIDSQTRCSEHEQRAFWEWLNLRQPRIRYLGRRHHTSWVIQVTG